MSMRDIDAMLADHDRDQPDRLADIGVVTTDGYGDVPRTTWPRYSKKWTEEDRKERLYWVQRLYGDLGLAITVVAETLGLSRWTVGGDVQALGIQRNDGRHGKGTRKSRRKLERRARVREIFEARKGQVTAAEIARILGAGPSTVGRDLQAMGLETPAAISKVPAGRLDRSIGRMVQQLADIGDYLLNHPELHLLQVTPELAAEWRKQLSKASRGIARVRKQLNHHRGVNQ